MPSLEPTPPRSVDLHTPLAKPGGAVSVVQELLARQAPWPPEDLRSAAAAIGELLSRWERYQRLHPGERGVELSPHFCGVVDALRDALAAPPSGAGR